MPEQGALGNAFGSHPLDSAREASMRALTGKGMQARCACGCEPVDVKRRKELDRKLHSKPLRRLSCMERNEGGRKPLKPTGGGGKGGDGGGKRERSSSSAAGEGVLSAVVKWGKTPKQGSPDR